MICFLSSPLRAIFCMNERSQTQHRRNLTQLACSFPPLSSSHGSGPKQSQSPGSVVVWRDYPFPQHEGLFFTSFCLLFTLFSVLSFSLSFQQCCSGFGSKVCRTRQRQACLHLKGRKKTILFPLALSYFVGSLPDPHHSLSPPLLLLWSAHSTVPLPSLFPPCHVKPQHPGNECHLTSFSLFIFL